MKFLNKVLMSYFVASLTLLAISCEKKTPINEQDKESLKVSLEMSETPEDFFGEVTLKVTVESNQEIERVVFYLNDNLIGETTEKPYEINWDTRGVEDGKYILRVVATDMSGNKTEDSRKVCVRNALMSIYMEEGYRSDALDYDFSEEWFFLTDKQGNLIGEPKTLNPTESISWERPIDFKDNKIVVNKFTYLNRKSTKYNPKVLYILDSYADQPSSDMVLPAGFSALNELGSAEINIDNHLPEGSAASYSVRTAYGSTPVNFADGGESITLIPVIYKKEQQKCLVTYTSTYAAEGEDRVPYFHWMDIQLNERYQISTDHFLPMQAKEILVPDEKKNANIYLQGYIGNEEDKRGAFFLSSLSLEAQIISGNLYFPEDIFSEYVVGGSIYVSDNCSYQFRLNTIPDKFAKPDFTATVAISDEKTLEIATNKKHDMLFVRWGYGEVVNGVWEYINRRLYLGKETEGKYVLPDFPEALIKEYPILDNPLSYEGTVLTDYKNISSYQEYFNGMYGNNSNNVDLSYQESILLLNNLADK